MTDISLRRPSLTSVCIVFEFDNQSAANKAFTGFREGLDGGTLVIQANKPIKHKSAFQVAFDKWSVTKTSQEVLEFITDTLKEYAEGGGVYWADGYSDGLGDVRRFILGQRLITEEEPMRGEHP